MRIFVTGGTGFIGSALIRKLIQLGHEVVALARRTDAFIEMGLKEVIPIQGDLSDSALLNRSVKGCQQAYHLAALARTWARPVHQFDHTNIIGTQNVLEACGLAQLEKVVYTSTVMAIGPTGDSVANETTPLSAHPLSHYQRTKAAAESVVSSYIGKGWPIVTVSPTLVFGKGAMTRRVSFNRFLQEFIRGKPIVVPGDGSQRLNCVYLDDVVEGHFLAMAQGVIGERYILGGENISLKELVSLVNQAAGLERTIRTIPYGLAKLLGLIEEFRARIMNDTPLITWESVETYRHSWTYSSQKAITQLGYSPLPLSDALKRTIQWIKNESVPL